MKMNKMKVTLLFLFIVLIVLSRYFGKNQKSPDNHKVGVLLDGSILVPSNKLLPTAGFQVYLPGRSVDLVLTPDEKFLLVKNMAYLNLIRLTYRTVCKFWGIVLNCTKLKLPQI